MDKVPGVVGILIADDHPMFRMGLQQVLQTEQGFQVVGEAQDGEQSVTLAHKLKPDILLLDVAMPGLSGLEVLHKLSTSDLSTRTILLTAHIEPTQFVEALHLGARGIVLKDAAPQMLVKSIRSVMAGQYWIGHESVANLVRALREFMPHEAEAARKKTFGLTPRELEIVSMIVAAYTNKEIAERFAISEETVKRHLTNIFDKLGVSNRLELALFALRNHLARNP
jgi:two-component system, NarL family, nitrate/nitrite response regulator NarL